MAHRWCCYPGCSAAHSPNGSPAVISCRSSSSEARRSVPYACSCWERVRKSMSAPLTWRNGAGGAYRSSAATALRSVSSGTRAKTAGSCPRSRRPARTCWSSGWALRSKSCGSTGTKTRSRQRSRYVWGRQSTSSPKRNAGPRIWMRRSGLEWIHRVASEPRRLSARYVRDGLALPGLVFREIRHTIARRQPLQRPARSRKPA